MKQIRLKIKSIQRDPEGDELDINIACDGTMEMRGGRIYIKYEEDISGEGDIVENTMSFDTGERDVISLSRIGDAKCRACLNAARGIPAIMNCRSVLLSWWFPQNVSTTALIMKKAAKYISNMRWSPAE